MTTENQTSCIAIIPTRGDEIYDEACIDIMSTSDLGADGAPVGASEPIVCLAMGAFPAEGLRLHDKDDIRRVSEVAGNGGWRLDWATLDESGPYPMLACERL